MLELNKREIPSNEWPEFFDQFSKDHLGALVDIETRADGRHQLQASSMPLEGITGDFEGTRSPAVEVIVGTETDRGLTRIIHNPSKVLVAVRDGVEEVLEIDSEDEGPTLLHFKSGPNPSLVKK